MIPEQSIEYYCRTTPIQGLGKNTGFNEWKLEKDKTTVLRMLFHRWRGGDGGVHSCTSQTFDPCQIHKAHGGYATVL